MPSDTAAPAATAPAPDARFTRLRIIGSVAAALVIYQAAFAIAHREPQAPDVLWNVVPIALAAASFAVLWMRRPAWFPAVLAIFVAVGINALMIPGDSTFAWMIVGLLVAALVAYFGYAYVVLPLLAWRRGRWSSLPIALDPFVVDAALPTKLQQRVRALEALGFSPRLMHVMSEGDVSGSLVFLTHARLDALGVAIQIAAGGRAFESTRISPLHALARTRLSVIDTQSPAAFPAPAEQRELLFPEASADTLLSHFVRLHDASVNDPAVVELLDDDDALIASLHHAQADQTRWLVQHGYLSPSVQAGEHRYTLKGGFSAVLRMLWPWSARERAQLIALGQAELAAATAHATE